MLSLPIIKNSTNLILLATKWLSSIVPCISYIYYVISFYVISYNTPTRDYYFIFTDEETGASARVHTALLLYGL